MSVGNVLQYVFRPVRSLVHVVFVTTGLICAAPVVLYNITTKGPKVSISRMMMRMSHATLCLMD